MRRTVLLLPLLLLACRDRNPQGEAVRNAYDRDAAAVDRAAAHQPTPTAQDIYRARADALREEGRDRQKGLEGGDPSRGEGGRGRGGAAGSRQGG